MKFLIDMNLSPRWAVLLRHEGWEATHWSEVGPATAPDQQVMAFAAANSYIVVTHDLDFGAILAVTHGKKPSVVQIRAENVSPETIGPQMVAGLRLTRSSLEAGALVTIEADHMRVRLLPLSGE